MDHDLLQVLLILLFSIVTVFTGFLGVDFKVCHDFTRSRNGLRFILNMRYWAISILYKRYHDARAEGMSESC